MNRLSVKKNLKQETKTKTYFAKLDPHSKIQSKIPGVFENSSLPHTLRVHSTSQVKFFSYKETIPKSLMKFLS